MMHQSFDDLDEIDFDSLFPFVIGFLGAVAFSRQLRNVPTVRAIRRRLPRF